MSTLVEKVLKVKFKSLSPILFCKAVHDDKEGETPEEHEKRTWKQRAHFEIAGSCVGIGHWRPGAPSCGNYGRFSVEKC
jgi:hypothetical protein